MMRPKIIYIMGSGHSGSTVLDVVLGNHPGIESVGALHQLHHSGWKKDDNRRCACGSGVHECAYWTEVHRYWVAEVGRDNLDRYIGLQNKLERHIRNWPHLLYQSRLKSSEFVQYSTMTAALFQAIHAVSGKKVIVDSSKNPRRGYLLLASGMFDLQLLHLVRDGRGVVWSGMKPRQKDVSAGIPQSRAAIPAWRTSLAWLHRNLESEWVLRRAGKDNAVRISYEELVTHPERALKPLELFVGADFLELAENWSEGQLMQVGHAVAGNRLRMSGAIKLRPDLEWTHKLPTKDKRIFWSMAGWLAKRYGYTP
jgi:hypothetical protein